jgi:hypothetical protein
MTGQAGAYSVFAWFSEQLLDLVKNHLRVVFLCVDIQLFALLHGVEATESS